MGVGAGLYMYDVVVKTFTFAISSTDEFLFFGSVRQIKLAICWLRCVQLLFGLQFHNYVSMINIS